MLQSLVHLPESQARWKSPLRPVQSEHSQIVQKEFEELKLDVIDIMKGYG